MIRIKCPKCSIVLNLDDDEAGQVGKCDDCGAKFRVPAKKAAAASKPSARAEEEEEEEKDEDEDEEDEGDERDEVSSKAAALAAKQAKMKIVTSIASGVGLLLLALGGVFINMVALLSAIISILLIVICVLLAMREAYRTPQLMMAVVGFVVLAGISVGAFFVHGHRESNYRQRMKKELDEKTALVQFSRDA